MRPFPLYTLYSLVCPNSMARKTIPDMSLEYPSFQNLESFSFSAATEARSSLPFPHSFAIQRYNEDSLVAGTRQIAIDDSSFETISRIGDSCPLCKGRKYGFTAYFHNLRIFSEPPHDILPLVEESYILRDRLKSLFITYTMRDVDNGAAETMMAHIHDWNFSIGALTDEVMNSASNSGFVLNLGCLDGVRSWKDATMDEFRYYVSDQPQMKLPKGRLAALMFEYRKVWEAVWIDYMQDRKMMLSELEGVNYPICM